MNQVEINNRIQELVLEKDKNKASYTVAEKAFISSYEGAGGLGAKGARGQGILYEFYTPEWLCKKMWQLAIHHGYQGGTVLEPASGTGRFIKDAPDPGLVTGFEINPISARISQILYPEAKIYTEYFESAFLSPPRFTSKLSKKVTWLDGYPFSLVISNPPYGKHTNHYSRYFSTPAMKQMELFFMYHTLRLISPGGLLVFLTSSNIIRSGISYQKEKDLIGKMATLVDAYRLPPVFKFSSVPTDIIILKKTHETL